MASLLFLQLLPYLPPASLSEAAAAAVEVIKKELVQTKNKNRDEWSKPRMGIDK
ncbi:hypothetical protein ES332_D12G007100v1 [Gossypium tomentosum]|uniref:Uncharacterized protein n=1 Tax=Gossypium tomentosum TaxID=34277 RepID=A0A5D2I3K5_GOSTO|nr:hypothetical protein ES332_D12G007100v1 [Gossypium tomentosum]